MLVRPYRNPAEKDRSRVIRRQRFDLLKQCSAERPRLLHKAHEWRGNHSVLSDYSEEGKGGSGERRWGPALKILLIRFPNLRSRSPVAHNRGNLRARPYIEYLNFDLGNPHGGGLL